MKVRVLIAMYAIWLAANAFGQGSFLAMNYSAPTRIGFAGGPLAGVTIWGQMLAGPEPTSLTPVGSPTNHGTTGVLRGGIVTIPDVPPRSLVYIQLVAWNGEMWGTTLGNVPLEWRGTTDIVPTFVTLYPIDPQAAPLFTQPAVVPIPEPGIAALFAVGCAIAAIGLVRVRQKG